MHYNPVLFIIIIIVRCFVIIRVKNIYTYFEKSYIPPKVSKKKKDIQNSKSVIKKLLKVIVSNIITLTHHAKTSSDRCI